MRGADACRAAAPALAQKRYGPGVTDTEIKIGTTTPYSGPASAYSAGAVPATAYFPMINEQGGVNGRKINYISLDDAYSPPKTVEQIRRLIESDEVAVPRQSRRHRDQHGRLQIHQPEGRAASFHRHGRNGLQRPRALSVDDELDAALRLRRRDLRRYILSIKPDAKIGILSQNDDLGRDYLLGFKRGLGDKAVEDDRLVADLQHQRSHRRFPGGFAEGSGADVFFIVTVPKFSAQAIRKAYDIDWHPQEFVVSVGSSIAGAIKPAGFEAAKGIISAAYQKDPADPQWADDPAMKAWNVWMDKYNPRINKSDYYAPYGYNIGFAVVALLKQCGDDLTRENIMKQASHLDMELPLLLPGIRLKTTPERPAPDQADAAGPFQRRALRAVQRRAREQLSRSASASAPLFEDCLGWYFVAIEFAGDASGMRGAFGGKVLIFAALAFLLPLLFAAPAAAEKRIALVVGNSAYQNVTRLDNPRNDAALMAETLAGLGFTLIGGRAQLDLDKSAMDTAVQNFGRQVQGADVALFYYAGHGVQVSGSNYLVPVGANPTREADVDFQMVDVNLVLRQMQGSGTRLNMVILDACRNNPFGARGLRASDGGLAQMRAPEGTLISYATQPGNVAQDGSDGHSPYTKALAATIKQPGLDIFQTFNQVGLAVKRETGGAQQPWVSSSPIDGTFYFVRACARPASPQVAVAPPPEPQLADHAAPGSRPDPDQGCRAAARIERPALRAQFRSGAARQQERHAACDQQIPGKEQHDADRRSHRRRADAAAQDGRSEAVGLDRLRPRQRQMGNVVEPCLAARGGRRCAQELRRRANVRSS